VGGGAQGPCGVRRRRPCWTASCTGLAAGLLSTLSRGCRRRTGKGRAALVPSSGSWSWRCRRGGGVRRRGEPWWRCSSSDSLCRTAGSWWPDSGARSQTAGGAARRGRASSARPGASGARLGSSGARPGARASPRRGGGRRWPRRRAAGKRSKCLEGERRSFNAWDPRMEGSLETQD